MHRRPADFAGGALALQRPPADRPCVFRYSSSSMWHAGRSANKRAPGWRLTCIHRPSRRCASAKWSSARVTRVAQLARRRRLDGDGPRIPRVRDIREETFHGIYEEGSRKGSRKVRVGAYIHVISNVEEFARSRRGWRGSKSSASVLRHAEAMLAKREQLEIVYGVYTNARQICCELFHQRSDKWLDHALQNIFH